MQYNGRLGVVIVGRSCPHIWRWQGVVVKDQISPVPPPPPPPFKKEQATYEQITLQGVPRGKEKKKIITRGWWIYVVCVLSLFAAHVGSGAVFLPPKKWRRRRSICSASSSTSLPLSPLLPSSSCFVVVVAIFTFFLPPPHFFRLRRKR